MRRFLSIILVIIIAAGSVFAVLAAGGSSDDPLVSVSALSNILFNPVYDYLREKTDQLKEDALSDLEEQIKEYYSSRLSDEAVKKLISDAAAKLAAQKVTDALKGDPSRISGYTETVALKKGEHIAGAPGSGFVLISGTGNISCPSGGSVINITTGSLRYDGFTIRDGIYYMITEADGSGLVITSDTASVMLFDGAYAVENVASAVSLSYADALYSLGLFYGTGKGYELERVPTRAEALVMLVRLLGEVSEARAHADDSPFIDLVGWENLYVSYSYEKKYTAGTSATTFSPTQPSSLDMYLSFVLRALGYQGDFVWNQTSRSFALSIGLISQKQLDSIAIYGFTRGDMVIISYNALYVQIKGSSMKLSDKLISKGAISAEGLEAAARYIK